MLRRICSQRSFGSTAVLVHGYFTDYIFVYSVQVILFSSSDYPLKHLYCSSKNILDMIIPINRYPIFFGLWFSLNNCRNERGPGIVDF